ncbi:MAG: HAD family hydrolase [bacterium]
MDVRLVLVDLGNTLINPEPAVEYQYLRVAKQMFPNHQFPEPEIIRERFLEAFRKCGPYGEELKYGTTFSEGYWYWKRVVGATFLSLAPSELEDLTKNLFDRFKRADSWRMRKGAHSFLEITGSRSLKLALVTNWDLRARELIHNLGVEQWFDDLFISSELGVEKPDPGIYQRVLESMDATPSETVMIGDEIGDDMKPAREVGMNTILLSPDATNRDWSPEVHTWSEIRNQIYSE